MFFCWGTSVVLVTPTHIYRKYHISARFLIKIIFFHFPPPEKIITFSGKNKYHLSRHYKKDCVQARISWKDNLSRTPEENIIFQVLFWERSSFLLCLRIRSYFQEKEISSFLIIEERSYSSVVFMERPCFQNIWKKKISFFVQCSFCKF